MKIVLDEYEIVGKVEGEKNEHVKSDDNKGFDKNSTNENLEETNEQKKNQINTTEQHFQGNQKRGVHIEQIKKQLSQKLTLEDHNIRSRSMSQKNGYKNNNMNNDHITHRGESVVNHMHIKEYPKKENPLLTNMVMEQGKENNKTQEKMEQIEKQEKQKNDNDTKGNLDESQNGEEIRHGKEHVEKEEDAKRGNEKRENEVEKEERKEEKQKEENKEGKEKEEKEEKEKEKEDEEKEKKKGEDTKQEKENTTNDGKKHYKVLIHAPACWKGDKFSSTPYLFVYDEVTKFYTYGESPLEIEKYIIDTREPNFKNRIMTIIFYQSLFECTTAVVLLKDSGRIATNSNSRIVDNSKNFGNSQNTFNDVSCNNIGLEQLPKPLSVFYLPICKIDLDNDSVKYRLALKSNNVLYSPSTQEAINAFENSLKISGQNINKFSLHFILKNKYYTSNDVLSFLNYETKLYGVPRSNLSSCLQKYKVNEKLQMSKRNILLSSAKSQVHTSFNNSINNINNNSYKNYSEQERFISLEKLRNKCESTSAYQTNHPIIESSCYPNVSNNLLMFSNDDESVYSKYSKGNKHMTLNKSEVHIYPNEKYGTYITKMGNDGMMHNDALSNCSKEKPNAFLRKLKRCEEFDTKDDILPDDSASMIFVQDKESALSGKGRNRRPEGGSTLTSNFRKVDNMIHSVSKFLQKKGNGAITNNLNTYPTDYVKGELEQETLNGPMNGQLRGSLNETLNENVEDKSVCYLQSQMNPHLKHLHTSNSFCSSYFNNEEHVVSAFTEIKRWLQKIEHKVNNMNREEASTSNLKIPKETEEDKEKEKEKEQKLNQIINFLTKNVKKNAKIKNEQALRICYLNFRNLYLIRKNEKIKFENQYLLKNYNQANEKPRRVITKMAQTILLLKYYSIKEKRNFSKKYENMMRHLQEEKNQLLNLIEEKKLEEEKRLNIHVMLSEELKQAREERESALNDVQIYKCEHEDVSGKYEELQKTLSALEKELRNIQKGKESLEKDIQNLQKEKDHEKTAGEKMKAEMKQLKKENDHMKKEIEQLKKESDILKKENETVKRETEMAKKENENLKRECNHIKRESENLKGDGEQYKQEIDFFKKEMELFKKDCDNFKKENDDLKKDGEKLKRENEQIRKEKEYFKKEREEVRKENENARRENEHLRKEKENIKRENENLKKDLNDFKAKYFNLKGVLEGEEKIYSKRVYELEQKLNSVLNEKEKCIKEAKDEVGSAKKVAKEKMEEINKLKKKIQCLKNAEEIYKNSQTDFLAFKKECVQSFNEVQAIIKEMTKKEKENTKKHSETIKNLEKKHKDNIERILDEKQNLLMENRYYKNLCSDQCEKIVAFDNNLTTVEKLLDNVLSQYSQFFNEPLNKKTSYLINKAFGKMHYKNIHTAKDNIKFIRRSLTPLKYNLNKNTSIYSSRNISPEVTNANTNKGNTRKCSISSKTNASYNITKTRPAYLNDNRSSFSDFPLEEKESDELSKSSYSLSFCCNRKVSQKNTQTPNVSGGLLRKQSAVTNKSGDAKKSPRREISEKTQPNSFITFLEKKTCKQSDADTKAVTNILKKQQEKDTPIGNGTPLGTIQLPKQMHERDSETEVDKESKTCEQEYGQMHGQAADDFNEVNANNKNPQKYANDDILQSQKNEQLEHILAETEINNSVTLENKEDAIIVKKTVEEFNNLQQEKQDVDSNVDPVVLADANIEPTSCCINVHTYPNESSKSCSKPVSIRSMSNQKTTKSSTLPHTVSVLTTNKYRFAEKSSNTITKGGVARTMNSSKIHSIKENRTIATKNDLHNGASYSLPKSSLFSPRKKMTGTCPCAKIENISDKIYPAGISGNKVATTNDSSSTTTAANVDSVGPKYVTHYKCISIENFSNHNKEGKSAQDITDSKQLKNVNI